MSLLNNDLFLVERSGTQYQMTADEIADFVTAIRDFSASTITDRDNLTGLSVGDRVFVVDASADATVDSGWAIYRVLSTGPDTFTKIQEQESLDLVVSGGSTDLSYTLSPTQGTITSSTGNDAVIPLADGTNAGLASPAMFNNSHTAASTTGTAATNPVTVNGSQQFSFSIGGLSALP